MSRLATSRPTARASSTRTSATSASPGCRSGCPVWSAMRLNEPGESIVVVPSVAPDRPEVSGAELQALRGALPVPAAPAAPAAAADDLRHRAADRPSASSSTTSRCCRASSRATPARACTWSPPHDGSPRPLTDEAARAAADPGADPRPHPRPRALPPHPLRDDDARARPRAGARHPALRRRPAAAPAGHQDRLPPAVRRRPASRTRWASRTSHDLDDVVDALARLRAARPGATRRDRQAQRGRLGPGNAHGRPSRAARRRDRPSERAALRERARGDGLRAPRRCASSATSAGLREGGGIVEERVGGVEVRSPSVQLRVTPLGEVELLSTHDQLLGGPSGQSYLGCRFPADFAYARAITAEAAKIGAQLAARGRARPLRGRLRRRPRRARRLGSVRDRAQPAQGRHDAPVPDAAVPHRTAATTPSRGCSRHRADARSTSWRPTTSSRSSCAG